MLIVIEQGLVLTVRLLPAIGWTLLAIRMVLPAIVRILPAFCTILSAIVMDEKFFMCANSLELSFLFVVKVDF
ncbi:hypothetical protein [Lysinibacillus sp. 38-6]|uniref:hypothetical protein n=1 Tax=Lysinibacillus sp. 38-6 TaxID=3385991 RepID=UPI003908AD67